MTHEEIRSAAAVITANVNALCNAKTSDEATAAFITVKDQLIKLFQEKVAEVSR